MPSSAGFLAHLAADGAGFADAIGGALEATVPACPDWTGFGLAEHLLHVHRFVESVVTERASSRIAAAPLDEPLEPATICSTYLAGLDRLLATLSSVAGEEAVWNWTPSAPHVASFWHRRMAQETAVHRVDAQQAAGTDPDPVDSDLAADGIDEVVDIMLPRWIRPDAALPGSLHLHRTDGEGEWTVRVADGTMHVERGHGKADAALRGPASDLLLWCWNRVPTERLEVFGNPTVPAAWPGLLPS